MNEVKHTPGPWHIDEAEFEATIYVAKNGDHDDQREVATVKILRIVPDHAREDLANLALIARAPELQVENERLRADLATATAIAHEFDRRNEESKKALAEAEADVEQLQVARLSAMPKARHEELMNLWRNYGDACRAENEGRACPDGMSTRDLEVDMAAAFKELLDAAEVK